MLSRHVLQPRHIVSLLPRLRPAYLPVTRLVAQARYRSKFAKDAPSALSNLKDPFAPKPEAPASLRPDEDEPRESKFRTWALTVNRIGSFAVIPMMLLYCVFLADWGDHEHVFMPARRWALRQKAAFYTLTPAEQELIIPKEMVRVHRMRDMHKKPPAAAATDSSDSGSGPAVPSPEASASGSTSVVS